ncbi:unnamed protein product [Rodentolepis nana]|uniref:Transposase n=1 Tax=Rodentolepis nana TaxID=102285 RepID=A0A0R3T852_RODNA|nr:unnamed protein product [Rodentolepis nana]
MKLCIEPDLQYLGISGAVTQLAIWEVRDEGTDVHRCITNELSDQSRLTNVADRLQEMAQVTKAFDFLSLFSKPSCLSTDADRVSVAI